LKYALWHYTHPKITIAEILKRNFSLILKIVSKYLNSAWSYRWNELSLVALPVIIILELIRDA
jgi:hypothetical protein